MLGFLVSSSLPAVLNISKLDALACVLVSHWRHVWVLPICLRCFCAQIRARSSKLNSGALLVLHLIETGAKQMPDHPLQTQTSKHIAVVQLVMDQT